MHRHPWADYQSFYVYLLKPVALFSFSHAYWNHSNNALNTKSRLLETLESVIFRVGCRIGESSWKTNVFMFRCGPAVKLSPWQSVRGSPCMTCVHGTAGRCVLLYLWISAWGNTRVPFVWIVEGSLINVFQSENVLVLKCIDEKYWEKYWK